MESDNIALIRISEVWKMQRPGYWKCRRCKDGDIGSAEDVRTGILEVRAETQQGNVYMNGKHR